MGVWMHMLSFQHKVGWRDVEIYMQTVLMRRLPGGAWHWVGRSSSYSVHTEVGAKPVLWANFLEWLLLMITAIGVVGLFLTDAGLAIRSGLIILSLVLGIILANRWFPKKLGAGRRVAMGFSWMVAYGGSWIMGGLILYLLMNAGQSTDITAVNATAIWAIAGGVSMLMIIAPSGLGVRELSLALLLSPYVPLSFAILVALLIRLTFTLADVIWGTSGWLISRSINRRLGEKKGDEELQTLDHSNSVDLEPGESSE
jgi:hypothetical protein